MTARFSRAAQQSVEFARTARGHRPRLQLTEYRLNWNSSTSGVLRLVLSVPPGLRRGYVLKPLRGGSIVNGDPYREKECVQLGGVFRMAIKRMRQRFEDWDDAR